MPKKMKFLAWLDQGGLNTANKVPEKERVLLYPRLHKVREVFRSTKKDAFLPCIQVFNI